MDFRLSEEQRLARDSVREFAEKEIEPIASGIEARREFPWGTVRKMAELGLMGMTVPLEYGGAGLDSVSYALAIEELARISASVSVIFTVNNTLACEPLLRFGSEAQKEKYLVPLAKGEKLGAYALTEPGAGSDAAALATEAVSDGGEFIINGTKVFTTNGNEADVFIVFARTEKTVQKHRGISAFVIERDAPGFKVGREEEKLGIRATSTTELVFKDCVISSDQLLGELNKGFVYAMMTLDSGRIGVGAQAIGIAQASLDASLKYSGERVQFGRTISKHQAIRFMLADMATDIEASRLLVLRAAQMKDRGMKFTKEASMAKLFASETAMRCAWRAVQIHGGAGYTTEYPVERYFRDAKITEIYEGTSEIQRLVIARELLKG
ncbi:MAG: acyl-CoA dehydrogenase [Candidatus Geothermarchaeales archaeon]